MEEMRFWVQRVYMQLGSRWEPAVDVCEDDEAYYIIVEVAGLDRQDFEVKYLPNGTLVVRGARRPLNIGSVQCLVLEIPYGTFERHIALPSSIDSDGITAEYHAGLLLVRVPKKPPLERARVIPIKP